MLLKVCLGLSRSTVSYRVWQQAVASLRCRGRCSRARTRVTALGPPEGRAIQSQTWPWWQCLLQAVNQRSFSTDLEGTVPGNYIYTHIWLTNPCWCMLLKVCLGLSRSTVSYRVWQQAVASLRCRGRCSRARTRVTALGPPEGRAIQSQTWPWWPCLLQAVNHRSFSTDLEGTVPGMLIISIFFARCDGGWVVVITLGVS